MGIKIIPISKTVYKKNFDCGIEDLNLYLRQFSVPNDKKNIGKTFVAVDELSPLSPLGYYTVSMAQINVENIPEEIRNGLPRYPVPAMRIGKLAVNLKQQGKKIGAKLLKDSLLRAVKISSEVAVKFVVVDAVNKKAMSFYLKYGFVPLKEAPLTLIIPIETIRKAYEGKSSE